jgi:hypothetical protein
VICYGYGRDVWRDLDGRCTESTNMATVDYTYSGKYDDKAFQREYKTAFKDVPKYNEPSMPDLQYVLGKLGTDSRIVDIRWAAYILGTMFVESSHTVKVQKQIADKKGKVKTQTLKVWRNYQPVDEVGRGKGLLYERPVKVKRLPNGNARITEWDGDQWTISASSGKAVPVGTPKRGADPSKPSDPAYDADDGNPELYFGRGYVQITWWSNYAAAGVELNQGLAFLFDPEKIKDPETAYAITATAMCEGQIFTGGRKLADYFIGGYTNYVGARDMVNPGAPHANKVEVAKIAERFEKVLFASKIGIASTVQAAP